MSISHKIAVIGSGASGFYTALNVLKHKPATHVHIFEKNPNPFGLVRYGVAPDHPEVKNCIDSFNELSESPNFQYFGNVEVGNNGSTIGLKEMHEKYNAVVYAYGANAPNIPRIAGSDHPGVIDSFSFVNWYNGHPKFKDLNVPLEKVKNVAIVGNGNVAIDIIRILLADPKHWEKTDISDIALEKLRESKVEHVSVVARRGVLESKFTNKELRELLELEGVKFQGWNKEEMMKQIEDTKLDRINKRRISLLDKNYEKDGFKTWDIKYLHDPIGVKVKNNELLEDLICKRNKVVKSESGDWKIENDLGINNVQCDLVITATGYKCEPLDDFEDIGIKFAGKIINNDGKIEGINNGYAVGWIRTGATGNINSTYVDSTLVSDMIINDLKNDNEFKSGIDRELKNAIDWSSWEKIHEYEVLKGKEEGKPMKKISFDEMLSLVKRD
ncbi:hypothetical protein CANINC_000178 [Pichia inconspicua]|uniref:NADPH:adrenodoxin oxidoreductase, mitochondrial n=1 Tax=Pichia inconspicua TaxID=52247 RepID=A0A4T0X773_9ASCO|nr:hypothetical protein CANINC_000178 [[Candida] inconspicua]